MANLETNLRSPLGVSFSSEIVNKALEIEQISKQDRKLDENKTKINEAKIQLKAEFKENKKALISKVKEKIVEIDEKLNKDIEEIKATLQEALEGAEKAHESNLSSLNIEDPKELKAATAKIETEYKNSIKGAKFVAKRSGIKAQNDHDLAVRDTKLLLEDLYFDYALLIQGIEHKKTTPILDLVKTVDVFIETFNPKEFFLNKQRWINAIPFIMLVVLIIAYFIAKAITGYQGDLTNIVNNGVFIAVVATGAVFIYSGGSFDMSLGPASLMCATLTGITFNATHDIFTSLVVALIVGSLLGIVNAVLANVLNLPVMVMTLTMMNILNAIHAVILETQGGDMKIEQGMAGAVEGADTTLLIVYATCLVTFFLLLWAIFNYTKVGRRNKFIGSNSTAAKYNGISLMKAGIISFGISGIGLGLCGFLFAMSKSVAQSAYSAGTILDTIGLNVVIAIVFGGMTTSGGPRSRVSCAIIGALFCIFLDEFFRAAGIADYRYMAKGIIFLAVSFANMYNSRTKMLAR